MTKLFGSFIVLLLSLVFFSQEAYSQLHYKSAVGARFDAVVGGSSGPSATYKVFLGDKFALEGIASFRFSTPSSFSLAALGQIHNELGVEGLLWHVGAGPGFVIVNSSTSFNLVTITGLDYAFGNIPINLTLDVFPTIRFENFNIDLPLSFGIRYILAR